MFCSEDDNDGSQQMDIMGYLSSCIQFSALDAQYIVQYYFVHNSLSATHIKCNIHYFRNIITFLKYPNWQAPVRLPAFIECNMSHNNTMSYEIGSKNISTDFLYLIHLVLLVKVIKILH